MSEFKLLIDGTDSVGGAGTWEEVTDPATGEVIGCVAYATNEDLDRAVEAAKRGLRAWSAVTPWERGAILKKIGFDPAGTQGIAGPCHDPRAGQASLRGGR